MLCAVLATPRLATAQAPAAITTPDKVETIRKGMLSIGVKDNQVLVFSELMDAKSLFLTANADTVY